ncbi:hypothetical protein [Williamsia sp. 1135]|uniref:type IV toxin-antitoxin system AbiEi family antitoxin domain-containing protein n=1 Tax=Williamsia sp. 1135 TaxID=1889262 RepID=UPI000A11741D|nr:hypothetical protein [Williamsia sp. 1135]ORM32222.1 hypothetical protein BFL43_16760 [Williamsia sp. 1135]
MNEPNADNSRIIRRRDAVQIGELDRRLATRVKTGQLTRIQRGFYTFTSDLVELDRFDRERELYRRTVLAAADNGEPGKAISHWSAAVLHGLPMLNGDLKRVHFTANRIGGGHRKGRGCVIHGSTWNPHEVVMVGEYLVTSPARTAIDIARSGTFYQAVCVLDGALFTGVPRSELENALRGSVGRTGVSIARAALAVADGKAESIGESLSRAMMLSFGDIPLARLQNRFLDADGTFVARTDFDWDGLVAGEFDGHAKYVRYLRPGETTEQAYEREKWREQKLRRIGVFVVRWNWKDLEHPARFRRILVQALTTHGLMAAA